MLAIQYNSLPFANVEDLGDFFKTNLPEMTKLRSMIEACKLMTDLPSKKVLLTVAQGERIYKITFLSPGIHNIPIGWFVYIPQQRRLDFYISDSPVIPIIQWKGKKIEFKNYPMIYDRMGFDDMFIRIVNII